MILATIPSLRLWRKVQFKPENNTKGIFFEDPKFNLNLDTLSALGELL